MCKICIAQHLVVDIFPWCNVYFVPSPRRTLVAGRMRNGSIDSWQKLEFKPIVCIIILVTQLNFGIMVWIQLKLSGHFLVFSYTAPCEEDTNMAVKNAMTCKIGLIWRHMKTPYYNLYIYNWILRRYIFCLCTCLRPLHSLVPKLVPTLVSYDGKKWLWWSRAMCRTIP